jgi:hypothetical protein
VFCGSELGFRAFCGVRRNKQRQDVTAICSFSLTTTIAKERTTHTNTVPEIYLH